MPIGVSGIEEKSFRNNVVKMKKGDVLYIFTDGFPDQFGGKAFPELNTPHIILKNK